MNNAQLNYIYLFAKELLSHFLFQLFNNNGQILLTYSITDLVFSVLLMWVIIIINALLWFFIIRGKCLVI